MKAQTEKQQRFMALFLPAQPRLERFVLALTRDGERAKDVVGETILIAFQRLETLRHDKAFLSFLFTVATRVARRRAHTNDMVPLEDDHVERLLDPATPADVVADIGLLHEALQQLPEKQREALLLFEIAGFSTAEVREIQGGTLVAARVRIARGRKRLAELLGAGTETARTTVAARPGNRNTNDSILTAIETELEQELGVQR